MTVVGQPTWVRSTSSGELLLQDRRRLRAIGIVLALCVPLTAIVVAIACAPVALGLADRLVAGVAGGFGLVVTAVGAWRVPRTGVRVGQHDLTVIGFAGTKVVPREEVVDVVPGYRGPAVTGLALVMRDGRKIAVEGLATQVTADTAAKASLVMHLISTGRIDGS